MTFSILTEERRPGTIRDVLQNINRIYFIFTFAVDFSFLLTIHLNNPQLRPDITAAVKNFRVQPEWYNPAVSAKFFINENLTTVKARCEAIKMGEKSALEITDEAFAW